MCIKKRLSQTDYLKVSFWYIVLLNQVYNGPGGACGCSSMAALLGITVTDADAPLPLNSRPGGSLRHQAALTATLPDTDDGSNTAQAVERTQTLQERNLELFSRLEEVGAFSSEVAEIRNNIATLNTPWVRKCASFWCTRLRANSEFATCFGDSMVALAEEIDRYNQLPSDSRPAFSSIIWERARDVSLSALKEARMISVAPEDRQTFEQLCLASVTLERQLQQQPSPEDVVASYRATCPDPVSDAEAMRILCAGRRPASLDGDTTGKSDLPALGNIIPDHREQSPDTSGIRKALISDVMSHLPRSHQLIIMWEFGLGVPEKPADEVRHILALSLDEYDHMHQQAINAFVNEDHLVAKPVKLLSRARSNEAQQYASIGLPTATKDQSTAVRLHLGIDSPPLNEEEIARCMKIAAGEAKRLLKAGLEKLRRRVNSPIYKKQVAVREKLVRYIDLLQKKMSASDFGVLNQWYNLDGKHTEHKPLVQIKKELGCTTSMDKVRKRAFTIIDNPFPKTREQLEREAVKIELLKNRSKIKNLPPRYKRSLTLVYGLDHPHSSHTRSPRHVATMVGLSKSAVILHIKPAREYVLGQGEKPPLRYTLDETRAIFAEKREQLNELPDRLQSYVKLVTGEFGQSEPLDYDGAAAALGKSKSSAVVAVGEARTLLLGLRLKRRRAPMTEGAKQARRQLRQERKQLIAKIDAVQALPEAQRESVETVYQLNAIEDIRILSIAEAAHRIGRSPGGVGKSLSMGMQKVLGTNSDKKSARRSALSKKTAVR